MNRAWLFLAFCAAAPVAATFAQSAKLDRELAYGIERVKEGDYEVAVKILDAVTWKLEGDPRRIRDLAQAHLYLGIAYLELDDEAAARKNFRFAQRYDRKLKLRATEFSAQVIRVFEGARQDEIPAEQAAAPSPSPSPTPLVIGDSTRWLEEYTGLIELKLGHAHEGTTDAGSLRVSTASRQVSWRGDPSTGCRFGFDWGFEDIKAVSAARGAGFVIEHATNVGKKATFIPAPHASWLLKAVTSPGAVKQADLPRDVQFDVNLAVRRILEALGRTSSAAGGLPDAIYGIPIDATLPDLMETPSDYEGRSVRVRGRLDIVSRERGEFLLFADTWQVLVTPAPEIAALVRAKAREWANKDLEITGVFRRRPLPLHVEPAKTPAFAIRFWDYLAPGAERPPPPKVAGQPMMLEDLVMEPDRLAGQNVRVVGRFRGRNLHGDLPLDSRRRVTDWVIKDDLFAAWITGREAVGDGFSLDATSYRDTVAWVAVTGKVEVHDGFTYVRAAMVEMSPPPSANARVRMALPKGPVANLPPTVVMTVPLEFEEIAPDGRLTIQFSQDMNEESFRDRVELRYAEGTEQQPLTRARVLYDDRRRAIVVEPSVLLRPGRIVEFRLLKGIIDAQGRPLVARDSGAPPADVADVVRYKVGS